MASKALRTHRNTRMLQPINISDKAGATRGLAQRLLFIMKRHIGEENKITQEELFSELFRQDMDLEHRFDHWAWWEFVKKAMHYCRANTRCFITILRNSTGGYSYCIPKNDSDLHDYEKYLTDNIKRMKLMIAKGQRAIDEKWYRQQWELPLTKKEAKEQSMLPNYRRQ